MGNSTADPKRGREHAECHFYLGVSAGRAGDPGAAAASYEAAVARLAPLADADPQARYFLAGALGNLAGVLEYRGDAARARAAHERALPVHRQARAADPSNGGAFQDLVWTTLSVARLQPDPARAVAALTAAHPLVEEYSQKFPTDFSRVEVQCVYRQELSAALLRAGRRDEALVSAAAALVAAGELAQYPPRFQHPEAQAGAWVAEAAARSAAGEHDAAETAWRKAVSLFGARDWGNLMAVIGHGKSAEVCDRLAEAADRRGDPAEAAARRKQAADTRDRLRREHPEFKPCE